MALLRTPRPRSLGHHLLRAVLVALAGTLGAAAALPLVTEGDVPALPMLPAAPGTAQVAPADLHPDAGTGHGAGHGVGRAPGTAATVGALMQHYRCSTGRLDPDATPRSALVRSANGLRVVDFDRGWQIFTEQGPSALAAVCLLPPD